MKALITFFDDNGMIIGRPNFIAYPSEQVEGEMSTTYYFRLAFTIAKPIKAIKGDEIIFDEFVGEDLEEHFVDKGE